MPDKLTWESWVVLLFREEGLLVMRALDERLVRIECGWSLPLSRLASHSLMDEKGNMVERDAPASTPWPVPRRSLRPWQRVTESMMRDIPTHYGGRRVAA